MFTLLSAFFLLCETGQQTLKEMTDYTTKNFRQNRVWATFSEEHHKPLHHFAGNLRFVYYHLRSEPTTSSRDMYLQALDTLDNTLRNAAGQKLWFWQRSFCTIAEKEQNIAELLQKILFEKTEAEILDTHGEIIRTINRELRNIQESRGTHKFHNRVAHACYESGASTINGLFNLAERAKKLAG
ncbi:MAG: hypothetical protein H6850_02340 [Alphaproteobacteria bacterium]|nr:MAG: hypothetical protein H6850_02340 [Alphaproteobacteria bacterium]